MKLLTTTLLLFLYNFSHSQSDCSCTQELNFVTGFYEENLPSYPNTVNSNPSAYETMLDSLKGKAIDIVGVYDCFILLTRYVEYFNDKHSSIFMPPLSGNHAEEVEVDSILSKETKVRLHPDSLAKFPLEDIRGLYTVADNAPFEVAIVSDDNSPNAYQGRIVSSQVDAFANGNLLLKLRRDTNDAYDVFSYNKNGALSFTRNIR